jgi:hypothetical protein
MAGLQKEEMVTPDKSPGPYEGFRQVVSLMVGELIARSATE